MAFTRSSRANPCPVCDSHPDAPRGKGLRCTGFVTDAGWIHCSREEFAGDCKRHEGGVEPTWSHRGEGPCNCGKTHGTAPYEPPQGRGLRNGASNEVAKVKQAEVRDIGDARRAEIVETYDYEDRNGKLLYQVCRMHPKTFRQRRPNPHKKGEWLWTTKGLVRTLYRIPQLIAGLQAGDTVYLCFLPGTEILTRDGWIAIEKIQPEHQIANYWLPTSEVTFSSPKATQEFDFHGSIVEFQSKFCRLAVTPDHKMAAWFPGCRRNAISATEVRRQHQLPVAGHFSSGIEIDEEIVQLVAAWQADGIDEKRGHKVSWNLKKSRKLSRLTGLLDTLGIPYSLHNYPSCAAWTNVRIRRSDLTNVLKWVVRDGPDKIFSRDILSWSLRSRQTLIRELAQWDGNKCGQRGVRFFTASERNANIVTELAALSGWGSILHRDVRPGRPRYRDQFVLNLNDRQLRRIGSLPKRSRYTGRVHCVTVDSGFVIARRNGAVTIAGNCDGEKDVRSMEDAGCVATCNTGGSGPGKWTDKLAGCFVKFAIEGGKIRIIQDKDPDIKPNGQPHREGQIHARAIFDDLTKQLPDDYDITIVEAAVGKDATDHLEAGKTIEQLVQVYPYPDDLLQTDPERFKRMMIREALEANEVTLERIMNDDKPSQQPRFPTGIIGCNRLSHIEGVTVAAGEPSSGKSYFTISTAVAALNAGWEVFYLSCEMHKDIILDRMARAVVGAQIDLYDWQRKQVTEEALLRVKYATLSDDFWLMNVSDGITIDALVELLSNNVTEKPTLVILDSLSSFVDSLAEDPNDPYQMRPLRRAVRLATATRKLTHGHVAWILLSELNKEGKAKGRFLEHRADVGLAFKKNPDQDHMKGIQITKAWRGAGGDLGEFVLHWDLAHLVAPNPDTPAQPSYPDQDGGDLGI